jgi:hypothetical protein
MADSQYKIVGWQIIISAVVGLFWGVLLSLGDIEGDFFFDLPLGMLQGFVGGLVVLIVLAIVAGIVWALVRTFTDKPEDGFGGAMSTNMDTLAGMGPVQSYNSTIDSWTQSPIAWGIAWGVGSAFAWAMIAAVIWSTGVGSNVGVALLLLIGVIVPILINLGYGVTGGLSTLVGEGETSMVRVLSRVNKVWVMLRLPKDSMEFGAGFGFGLTGLIAFIAVEPTLAVFGFIFMLLGAFLGMMIKAMMES